MASELALNLAQGLHLVLRAMPDGIDVTVFAGDGLRSRVVHAADAALPARFMIEAGSRLLLGSTAFVTVTPAEATAVLAFVAMAKEAA
ncbi:hypothetical protein ACQKIE_18605 [Luteibacter sp. NPDC031894]|uniref:hypothetical protein n=1 Tax=Luteibacter sp. NPDC031894 TaxID=3390572 RepID=UPI003D05D085